MFGDYVPQGVPVGSMIMWPAEKAPPPGWLLCDGSNVSKAAYNALYRVIGDPLETWGTGSTADNFKLPDMRGVFPRGRDGTANRDPDKLTRSAIAGGGATGNRVGSFQNFANQAHTHPGPLHNHGLNVQTTFNGTARLTATNYIAGNNMLAYTPSDAVNTVSVANGGNGATGAASGQTSSESRPQNVYVDFIIKF